MVYYTCIISRSYYINLCIILKDIVYLLGNAEDVEKFNRRLVKVTKIHAEEAKQLLQLMGIPFIDVGKIRYV